MPLIFLNNVLLLQLMRADLSQQTNKGAATSGLVRAIREAISSAFLPDVQSSVCLPYSKFSALLAHPIFHASKAPGCRQLTRVPAGNETMRESMHHQFMSHLLQTWSFPSLAKLADSHCAIAARAAPGDSEKQISGSSGGRRMHSREPGPDSAKPPCHIGRTARASECCNMRQQVA